MPVSFPAVLLTSPRCAAETPRSLSAVRSSSWARQMRVSSCLLEPATATPPGHYVVLSALLSLRGLWQERHSIYWGVENGLLFSNPKFPDSMCWPRDNEEATASHYSNLRPSFLEATCFFLVFFFRNSISSLSLCADSGSYPSSQHFQSVSGKTQYRDQIYSPHNNAD